MYKFILAILLLMSSVAYADINKTECGKYYIHGDEVRIKIAQIVSNQQLVEKLLEAQVIKIDMTTSQAALDLAMGETKNDKVFKEAADDIVRETVKLKNAYTKIMFDMEIQEDSIRIIGETYVKHCGGYNPTPNDLGRACNKYPELKDTINCKVFRNLKKKNAKGQGLSAHSTLTHRGSTNRIIAKF